MPQDMTMMISGAASVLAAAAFVAIAALHGYWALGGFWPGHDADSLYRKVVGGAPGMRGPGRAATWAVAALLVGAALTVLGASGLVPLPVSARVARGAALIGAAVLAVRGLEGFIDHRLRPSTAGSPFVSLNRALYSPLCLALAALTALAAR